ncbi:hypothetical protein WME94_10910 [Sorangium sp. So ce429]
MSRRAAPEKDDFAALLVAGGLLGLGVLAMTYQDNEQRRQAFLGRLAAGLQAHGLAYASATFGRAAGNQPVWRVTLHTRDGGVRTHRVLLAEGTQPYAESTCDQVVARVVADAA